MSLIKMSFHLFAATENPSRFLKPKAELQMLNRVLPVNFILYFTSLWFTGI